MFELNVRQRIAALILLIFLGIGGILMFIGRNSRYADTYAAAAIVSDKIYVHVCGAVVKPGVFTIKPATRKFEVLQLAGGALPEADLSAVNLAEIALDGEQIYVPKKGEAINSSKVHKTVQHHNLFRNSPRNTPVSEVKVQWPLDLNGASAAELDKVPGIGPGLAAKILQYRNVRGRFETLDDLLKVGGIGKFKLEKFRTYLSVK